MNAFELSLLLTGLYLVTRYVALFCTALLTKSKSMLKNVDVKYDALVVVSIFLLSFLLLSQINLNSNSDDLITIVLISSISLLPVLVIYIIGPMRYLFKSKNYIFSDEYKQITSKYFKVPLNVIVVKSEIANAYATGILPFSKTIIINTGLDNMLSSDQITALLYHEIGHHKKNHMLQLLFVNLIWSFITITLFNYFIFPNREEIEFFPLILSSYYGIVVTGGVLFIAGAFQKKCEYEADKFSAENFNATEMASALTTLYNTSKLPHDQWNFNYPSLNQRIARIESCQTK